MKLIGELKKQVGSTNTKEEAKDVIANAGMELTDDELDNVVGGVTPEDKFNRLSDEDKELIRLKIENGEYLKLPM